MVDLLPDVEFDHTAAAAAAAACREAARAVGTTADERARGADHAGRFWQGRHAERFRDVQTALLVEADALRDDLERTARAIETAAEDARTEQHRRDTVNRERLRIEAERQRRAEEEAAADATTTTTTRGPW